MKKEKPIARIYVCHTIYHVYVALLKELNESEGQADIALSTIFMDFGDLKERLEASGIFREVFRMEEKADKEFPDIMKHNVDHKNIVVNMFHRIIYTKQLGKKQNEYIKIDFTNYQDIYVFCDSDPIGYYLNYHHIYYHALEDGMNSLKHFDGAHYDNRGHFKLKAALASKNIIFMQNGYSKYCRDMEVDDDSYFDYTFSKYKVVPRKKLEKALNASNRKKLVKVFIPQVDELVAQAGGKHDCVLYLTEAFPDNADVRKSVCDEVLEKYCGNAHVIIKPHPRDNLDYQSLYPQCTVLNGKFPIEVMNFIDGIHFSRGISIYSAALNGIDFADEKINIGPHIWDSYEPIEVHAFLIDSWEKNLAKKK